MIVCLGIACNGQMLPQLVAQLVSLDPDHHVIVHVGSHGIDLVLTHDPPTAVSAAQQRTEPSIGSHSSEPAHVIHFPSGPTLVDHTAAPVSATKLQVAGDIVATVPMHFAVFVPKATFVDSRPPPKRTAILFDRSTMLLI